MKFQPLQFTEGDGGPSLGALAVAVGLLAQRAAGATDGRVFDGAAGEGARAVGAGGKLNPSLLVGDPTVLFAAGGLSGVRAVLLLLRRTERVAHRSVESGNARDGG